MTSVSVPPQFVGGDGRGDIVGISSTLVTSVSVPAQFVGGDGRGDITGSSTTLTLECVNPTFAGVIAAAQSGTYPFNPAPSRAAALPVAKRAPSNTNGNHPPRAAARVSAT